MPNQDWVRMARTAARRSVERLPEPVRDAVLMVATARSADPHPGRRHFDFPADVADPEALRHELADTDIFGAATAEAEGYLGDALERFRITMAMIPALPPGARVLELGANPYFLTRLLRKRGYDVTCANYFGPSYDAGSVQTVTGPRSGERHVIEFDHFNVETDRFPYDDGAFDLVLCCEILEHLPSDPVHMLAEIHRLLAQPHGVMILTTPNATRTDNLVRVMAGENPYESLSGYGAYGRHNREYTVRELRDLLSTLGYSVEEVFAADIHAQTPAVPTCPGISRADRGDNLFVVARAVGEPRWRYPSWLYTSRHALRRVVRPDVLAGHNDELQATGVYDADPFGDGHVCWTGAAEHAVFTVTTDGAGPAVVRVEGFAPPPGAGDKVEMSISSGATSVTELLDCDDRPFRISLPVMVEAGLNEVRVEATPTWVPAERGLGPDFRRLGVAVRRVALLPPGVA